MLTIKFMTVFCRDGSKDYKFLSNDKTNSLFRKSGELVEKRQPIGGEIY